MRNYLKIEYEILQMDNIYLRLFGNLIDIINYNPISIMTLKVLE